MEIIGVVIAGIIIGWLGKWLAPGGRDNTGMVATVLCGVIGVVIGWYVAVGLGVAATDGVDWARWIISVIVAAAVVAVVATVTGRSVAGRL